MAESLCDEAHFKKVFIAESASLRNFFYYKTRSLQQAEDLVQEAFGKLWENCSKVVFEKAKSFLYKVANNSFLNQVAHQKVVLKFEGRPHTQKSEESPQYLMEEQEFKDRLMKAIMSLPDGQREVFLMNRIDKKKYREIAEILGLSVKAVEKRMHKALVQLRKTYKDL